MNKTHYVSLEIAQELKKAGLKFPKSETVFIFYHTFNYGKTRPKWIYRKNVNGTLLCLGDISIIPRPSLSEILDRLSIVSIIKFELDWECFHRVKRISTKANTAPDAAAKMLIKIKESE